MACIPIVSGRCGSRDRVSLEAGPALCFAVKENRLECRNLDAHQGVKRHWVFMNDWNKYESTGECLES